MKNCCITYQLHVNKNQYAYLCHEIQKSRQIYLNFCKYILVNKNISEKQLKSKFDTYLNKYAKFLNNDEKSAIYHDILSFYHKNEEKYICYYRCHKITKNGYWRNVNLFSLIQDIPAWQYIPIQRKWKITDSVIWYRKYKIYLQLQFCSEFLLCD